MLARWISLRHFVRSPLRTSLVVFGIALGVAMFVATAAVNETIRAAFVEAVDRVVGKTDLVVTSGDVGVPAELVEELAKVEGVAHVAGLLEVTTRLADGGPLLVLGLDLLGDRHFLQIRGEGGDDVTEDPLELVNDPLGILVAKRLADQQHLQVGGTLRLVTPDGPKDLHVRGILADEGPAAAYGGQVAVMYVEAVRESFARGEHVDRIDLAIAEGASLDAVKARVEAVVGARGLVDRPSGRARHLASVLGPAQAGIRVAGFVALLVGMFLIYNAVSIAVAQRRREIGVLRALGTTRGRIVRMFAVEAMLLASLGSAIGLVAARWIAEIALAQATPTVDQFYAPIIPRPPVIDLPLALSGLALGLLTTLVAAYLPARRAAAVDPIDAMRPVRAQVAVEAVPHRKLLAFAGILVVPALVTARLGTMWSGFAAIGFVIGAVVLAVPAAVLGLARLAHSASKRVLGIPGRLAIDNVVRSIERSSLTVAALTIAVAASLTARSWGWSLEVSLLDWIEHTIPADVSITNGSPLPDQKTIPFRADVVDRLADIPGVWAVSPVRIINHDVRGLRVQLASQPSEHYFRALAAKGLRLEVIEGEDPPRAEVYTSAPNVILSENAARRLQLHVGDPLELQTPSGPHDVRVGHVIVDYTSDLGMVFLDRRWFVEWWQDALLDTADLYAAPGADVDAIAKEAKRRLAEHTTIFVSTSSDLRREIRRVVLDTVAILRSTDLVAIIVALLGVVGTMLAAVIDRVREIGLLRAIGATRAQVVATVVAESGLLGLASMLLGLVASVPMGAIFVYVVALDATGWRLDYRFPVLVAVEVGLAVAFTAAIAGLVPGRMAAELDPKDALSYE